MSKFITLASENDDGPDANEAQIIGMKIERILLALSYLVMTLIACANIWNYLIKMKMYKSFPMTVAYIMLILYCSLGIGYELYMCIGCGEHDCVWMIYFAPNSESSWVDHFQWKQ